MHQIKEKYSKCETATQFISSITLLTSLVFNSLCKGWIKVFKVCLNFNSCKVSKTLTFKTLQLRPDSTFHLFNFYISLFKISICSSQKRSLNARWTDSSDKIHFHTHKGRKRPTKALDSLSSTTSTGSRVVRIEIRFYWWPCRLTWHFLSLTSHMAGNVIRSWKNTCIPPKAPSAHIHRSITQLTELTLRGHFSISGCWLDTFQPGVVVHLCDSVVRIKQGGCWC